jgi:hypothetical protein
MSIRWHVAEGNDDKYEAYTLRSLGYRRYYRNIPEGVYMDELDISSLSDGSPRSRTILVKEDGRAVGTGRASLIHSPRYPMMQSEIEFLFHLPCGLLDTIHAYAGYHPATVSVGELSRLTVQHETDNDEIMRQIFEGFVAVSQHFGIDVYMGITKDWIANRFREIGVDFIKIPDTYLVRDNPAALFYCVKHFDYFYPKLPKVLPELLDPDFFDNNTISYEELRELVDAMYPEDDVFLHWLSPQSIIQNALIPAYEKR